MATTWREPGCCSAFIAPEESPAYRDTARQLLDSVLESGLDRVHGGVFFRGALGGPATLRGKIWWVQAEAIVAFLLGYLVFGDARYWEAFMNVSDFCLRRLYNPEHGEWFAATAEDGSPRQMAKGSQWKAAFHITQACTFAHGYLSDIQKTGA